MVAPAGYSAAAIYVDQAGDATRPASYLADKLTSAGELASVLRGIDPTDAAIAWQFGLQRGSGIAVMEKGQDYAAIRKNTAAAPDALRHETQRVLQPFIARGDIDQVLIDVLAGEDAGDIGAVSVEYHNRRTDGRGRIRT